MSTDFEKQAPIAATTLPAADDEADLARMGYKQELKRDLGLLQVRQSVDALILALTWYLTDLRTSASRSRSFRSLLESRRCFFLAW